MSNKIGINRVIAILDFFYGFFFGCSIFAASLAFIITPDFFSSILLAVSFFTVFIFLMIMIRYFRIRIELAQMSLDAQIKIHESQEKILHLLYSDSQYNLVDSTLDNNHTNAGSN
ncbi:hypothetical protein LS73_005015 [Helicobacter muridarum]|uniref:Uncharacterized protein n=2 Tax=Helicobacter muridarum TaxID=216 RepID=A0A377PTK2_9HELI|nr:hypothetical protein [Helicobacter muridarum]TLE00346.1 hypothetical protein LS73_005015 [Helicobacter muridarum]STQ85850.1 Uncharacterised protein [Helicobacter muridarum]